MSKLYETLAEYDRAIPPMQKSVGKWVRLAIPESKVFAHAITCALCEEYIQKPSECGKSQKCPIAHATGREKCRGTPYYDPNSAEPASKMRSVMLAWMWELYDRLVRERAELARKGKQGLCMQCNEKQATYTQLESRPDGGNRVLEFCTKCWDAYEKPKKDELHDCAAFSCGHCGRDAIGRARHASGIRLCASCWGLYDGDGCYLVPVVRGGVHVRDCNWEVWRDGKYLQGVMGPYRVWEGKLQYALGSKWELSVIQGDVGPGLVLRTQKGYDRELPKGCRWATEAEEADAGVVPEEKQEDDEDVACAAYETTLLERIAYVKRNRTAEGWTSLLSLLHAQLEARRAERAEMRALQRKVEELWKRGE